MQRQECSLDQQFQQTAAQLTLLALSQPRAAKLRVQAWLTKLREPTSNVVWKRNRNNYCAVLLAQLQQGQLEPPFTSMPPDGSLPNLPNHLIYRALSPSRAGSRPQSSSTSPVGAAPHCRSPQNAGVGPQSHLAPEQLQGLVQTFHSNMQARGFDLTRSGPGGQRDVVDRPGGSTGPEIVRPAGPGGGTAEPRAQSSGRTGGSRLGPGRGEDAVKAAAVRGGRSTQAQRDQQRASRDARGDWGPRGVGTGDAAYTDQDAAAAALLAAKEAEIAARVAAKRQQQAEQQRQQHASEGVAARRQQQQQQQNATAKAHLDDVIARYRDARYRWASPPGKGPDYVGNGARAGEARGFASAWSPHEAAAAPEARQEAPASTGTGGGANLQPRLIGGTSSGSGSALPGALRSSSPAGAKAENHPLEPTLRLAPSRQEPTPERHSHLGDSPPCGSPSPARGGRYGAPRAAADRARGRVASAGDGDGGGAAGLSSPGRARDGAAGRSRQMLASLLASPRHLGTPRYHLTSSYSPHSNSPPSARARSRSSSPGASPSCRRVWTSPDPAITYSVTRRMRSSPRALEVLAKDALAQRAATSPVAGGAAGLLLVPRPLIYDGAKRRPARAKFEFSGLISSLLPPAPAVSSAGGPLPQQVVGDGSPDTRRGTGSPQHCQEHIPRPPESPRDVSNRSGGGFRAQRYDAGSKCEVEPMLPPREGRCTAGGRGNGEFESPGSSVRSGSPRAAWPQVDRPDQPAHGGGATGDGSHLPSTSVASGSSGGPTQSSRSQQSLALRLASPPASPRRLAAKAAAAVAGQSSPRRPSPLGGRAPPADLTPGDPPPGQRVEARSTERMKRPVSGLTAASAAAPPATRSRPPFVPSSCHGSAAQSRPAFVPASRLSSASRSRPASVPTSRLASASASRPTSVATTRPSSVPPSSRYGLARQQADAAASAMEHARSRSSRVPSTQQSSLRGFTTSSTASMPSSIQLTEMARRKLAASLPSGFSFTSSQGTGGAAAVDPHGWGGLAGGGGGGMGVTDPDASSGAPYTSWSRFGPMSAGSRSTGTGGGPGSIDGPAGAGGSNTSAGQQPSWSGAPGSPGRRAGSRGVTRSSDGLTGISSAFARNTDASGVARSSDGFTRLGGSDTSQPNWSRTAAAAMSRGGGGHSTKTIRSDWTETNASERSGKSGPQPASRLGGAADGHSAEGSGGAGGAPGAEAQGSSSSGGTVDLLSALGIQAQRVQETPTLLRTATAARISRPASPRAEHRAAAILRGSSGGGRAAAFGSHPFTPSQALGPGQAQPFVSAAAQVAGLAGHGLALMATRGGFAELSAAEAAGELALLDVEGVIREFERSLQDHLEFSLRPLPSRDLQPSAAGAGNDQVAARSGSQPGRSGGGGGAAFRSAASRLADRFALHSALADFRHAFDRLRRRLALHVSDPTVADALYGSSSSGGGAGSSGDAPGQHRYSSNPPQPRGHTRYDMHVGSGAQQPPWRPPGVGRSASVDTSGLRARSGGGDVSGPGGRRVAAVERFSRVASAAVAHYREDVALLLSRVRSVLQPPGGGAARHRLSSSGGGGDDTADAARQRRLEDLAEDDAAAAARELGLRRQLVSEVLNELEESAHQLGLQLVTLAAAPIDMPSPALSRLRDALHEHLDSPSARGSGDGSGRVGRYSSPGHINDAGRGGWYNSRGWAAGDGRRGRYSSPGDVSPRVGRPFADREAFDARYPSGSGDGSGSGLSNGTGVRRGPAAEAAAYARSGSEERLSTVGATAASDSLSSEALQMRTRLATWRHGEPTDWLGDMPTPAGPTDPDHASVSPRSISQPPSAWGVARASISSVDAVLQGSTTFGAAAPPTTTARGADASQQQLLVPELLREDTPSGPWRAGETALKLTREAHAARAAASVAREAALAAAREASTAVGLQAVQSQALEAVMSAVQEAAQLAARDAAAAAAERQAAQAAAAAAVREVQEAAQAAARNAASATVLEAAVVAERQYLHVASRKAAHMDALEAAVSAVREAAEATARQVDIAAAERQAAQAAAREAAQMSVHEAAAAAERQAAEAAARHATAERQAAQIAALEAAQVAAREAAAARETSELASREAAAVAREAALEAAQKAAQAAARDAAVTAAREVAAASAREAAALTAAREVAQATAREAAAAAAAREAAQAAALEAAAAAERQVALAAERESVQKEALEAAVKAAREAAEAARETVQSAALEAAQASARDMAAAEQREAARVSALEEAVSVARETARSITQELAAATERETAAKAERDAAVAAARAAAAAAERRATQAAEREAAAAKALEAAVEAAREAAVLAARETTDAAAREAAAAAEREAAAAAAREAATLAAAREAAKVVAQEAAAAAAAASEAALSAAREAAATAERQAAQAVERESAHASALEAAMATAREVAMLTAREIATESAREATIASAREAAAIAEHQAAWAVERQSTQVAAVEVAMATAREVAMLTAREIAAESAREATITSAREAVERQAAQVAEIGAAQRNAFEAALSMARDVAVAAEHRASQIVVRDAAAAVDMRELAAAAAREAAAAVFREAAAMSAQESAVAAVREEAAMAARDAAVAAARAAAEEAAAAAAERETATAAAALAAEAASSVAATRMKLLEASQRAAPFQRQEDHHPDGGDVGSDPRAALTHSGQHQARRARFDLAAASPHVPVDASSANAGRPDASHAAAPQSLSYRAVVWELPQTAQAADADGAASPSQALPLARGPSFDDDSGPSIAAAVAAATVAYEALHSSGQAPPPLSTTTSPRVPGAAREAQSDRRDARPASLGGLGMPPPLPPPPRPPSLERARAQLIGPGAQHDAEDVGPMGGGADGAGGERGSHGKPRSGIPRMFPDAPDARPESRPDVGAAAEASRRLTMAPDVSSSADFTLEDFRLRRQQLAASPPSRLRPCSAATTPSYTGLREYSGGSGSAVLQGSARGGHTPDVASRGSGAAAGARTGVSSATAASLGDGAPRDIAEFQLTKQRLGLVDPSSPSPRALQLALAAQQQQQLLGPLSRSASHGSASPRVLGQSVSCLPRALRRQVSDIGGEREPIDPAELALRLRRLTDRTTQLQERVSRLTLPLGAL